VTWFEINSAEPAQLADFYAKVFGWSLGSAEGPMEYLLADTEAGGKGISGGIGKAQGANQVIFYIEVDDPQAAIDRVEAGGGKVVVPVTEVPGMVTFAQFVDPQGNVIGLVKAS
jgi:predicted enzyme related to lactoylglutathione lyase